MQRGFSARPPSRAPDPLIQPNSWEFPSLFLLATTLAAADVWDWHAEDTLNIIAPIWLSLTLMGSALQMAMAEKRAIWAPLFWYRVSATLSFGVGAIAPVIANSATLLYMQEMYFFMPWDLQRVNLVSAVGVACVLGSALIFEKFRGPSGTPARKTQEIRPTRDTVRIGVGLFLIGASVNYLVMLPASLGLTNFVIPGFVMNVAAFELVGVSTLAIWSFAKSTTAVASLCGVVCVESAIGLLMFNKTWALLPWLAFVIGALSYKLTFTRLAVAGVGLWLSFSFLQPWVSFAREQAALLHVGDDEYKPSISERATVLASYFDRRKSESDPRDVQQSFARLSSVNAAAFVISQYDHGIPGNSLRDALYFFIPRVLWPEKPALMTGYELATQTSGQVGNAITAGVYAELYWNLGWIGLPLFLFPIGVFFNIATHFAAWVFQREDWTYLPLLFMNLKLGLASEGWYVGIIGMMAQCVALYFVLKFGGQAIRALGLLQPLKSSA